MRTHSVRRHSGNETKTSVDRATFPHVLPLAATLETPLLPCLFSETTTEERNMSPQRFRALHVATSKRFHGASKVGTTRTNLRRPREKQSRNRKPTLRYVAACESARVPRTPFQSPPREHNGGSFRSTATKALTRHKQNAHAKRVGNVAATET